ncbi:MAG: family 10 glycosylhydrolase [Candidatus Limnocylindria bacterium]
MGGILVALAALALTVALVPSAPAGAPAAAASASFRAYWVDAFGEGLYDQAQIEQVVAATKAANMNAIVAQVVRRGDCFCNRSSLPRTEAAGVAPFPFDPLQALIDTAHAQGIEVHAWIISTAVWRGDTAPADPAHAFNTHGPSQTGEANWLNRHWEGGNRVATDWYIDPGHPGAADYMVRMATSIVQAYDVDGINLDRIRYPDGNIATNTPSWGYNPVAVSRFQALAGRTDLPQPGDAQWAQWRRDQVTAIVRRIYVESYALKRNVRISADTIVYGGGPQSQGGWENTRTYAEQLQDWRGWMRDGILDLNIPMNYKRDAVENQRQMYLEWSDFTKDNQFGRHAAIGSALYLNEIPASVRQVRTALAPSPSGNTAAGWVGYSYRNPDTLATNGQRSGAASRAELEQALTQASSFDPITPPAFVEATAVPPMPWKAQPTTGQLQGVVRSVDGGPLDQARVLLHDAATGQSLRETLSDGVGWFAFPNLPAGSYRATVSSPIAATGAGVATVTAGSVSTVVPASPTGQCASTVGPGIPPPATLPSGLSGFHAAWYGQSGYPTLCAGERSTAVVAYYNSGTRGWLSGAMGQVAYLGTWVPEPGQDRASMLGGDGQFGSPDTGWPRYDRVALQPHHWVGPNQVAWFQFTIQAPAMPGTYRLYIRPLVEGATWMEDYGVYWLVTVR